MPNETDRSLPGVGRLRSASRDLTRRIEILEAIGMPIIFDAATHRVRCDHCEESAIIGSLSCTDSRPFVREEIPHISRRFAPLEPSPNASSRQRSRNRNGVRRAATH